MDPSFRWDDWIQNQMKKIALTGSIATGKSTVMRQFAQHGIAVLDADRLVHQLLAEGGLAVNPVGHAFPETKKGNTIDRLSLGNIVFNDTKQLAKLEAILHPLVRVQEESYIRQLRQFGFKQVIVEIPLLFESGSNKRFDQVIVTTASPFLIHKRALSRPNMNAEKLKQILARQLPDHKKRLRADHVIHTGLGMRLSLCMTGS